MDLVKANGHVDEYEFLAAMVIRQALEDIKHIVKEKKFNDKRKTTRATKEGNEALLWLLGDDTTLEFWCDAIGVSVDMIQDKAEDIINKG